MFFNIFKPNRQNLGGPFMVKVAQWMNHSEICHIAHAPHAPPTTGGTYPGLCDGLNDIFILYDGEETLFPLMRYETDIFIEYLKH